MRPLAVEAGAGSDGDGDFLPSHTGPRSIVIQCDAAVSTAAEAGAAALADIAGAVAPVDLAGTNVPAIAGMKFSAVAEVHSSAVDDEGDPSVVHTSRQQSAVILDPMVAPRKDGGPTEEIYLLEPLEHSVLEVSLAQPEDGEAIVRVIHVHKKPSYLTKGNYNRCHSVIHVPTVHCIAVCLVTPPSVLTSSLRM